MGYSFPDVIDCLNINKQDVPALGAKFNVRPFSGNLFTVANSFGQRVGTIRGADDLHPTFETTNKMLAQAVHGDSWLPMGPAGGQRRRGKYPRTCVSGSADDRWLAVQPLSGD
jgi:hypothetical protein